MSRSALVAAVLALTGGAALAQSLEPSNLPLQPPPADSTVGEVSIEAPKIIERSRLGVVTLEATMSVRVPYGDLDLKTPQGSAELDRRVRVAANSVCDQLERRYPEGSPERFWCTKNAIAGTRPQVIKARNRL